MCVGLESRCSAVCKSSCTRCLGVLRCFHVCLVCRFFFLVASVGMRASYVPWYVCLACIPYTIGASSPARNEIHEMYCTVLQRTLRARMCACAHAWRYGRARNSTLVFSRLMSCPVPFFPVCVLSPSFPACVFFPSSPPCCAHNSRKSSPRYPRTRHRGDVVV